MTRSLHLYVPVHAYLPYTVKNGCVAEIEGRLTILHNASSKNETADCKIFRFESTLEIRKKPDFVTENEAPYEPVARGCERLCIGHARLFFLRFEVPCYFYSLFF